MRHSLHAASPPQPPLRPGSIRQLLWKTRTPSWALEFHLGQGGGVGVLRSGCKPRYRSV